MRGVYALVRGVYAAMRGIHNCCRAKLRFARPEGRKAYPCYLTVRFISMFSLSQAGATPGEGLQLAKLVWPSLAPGRIKTVRFKCTVFRRRAFVFSLSAHAAGALSFLGDQERKQRSRRECDSPLPTTVETENRTFPGQQPLSVLRHLVRNREYILNYS